MENHSYEAEIIAEILDFWQGIPNSAFQKLADNVEIPKAAKLWEKRALLFYQRFGSQTAKSSFQVRWDDLIWKYYRSVHIESRYSGTFLGLQYPAKCFRLQGLSRGFYEKLISRWTMEPEKSLYKLFETILTEARNILADLNSGELTYLKAAARSINNSASQDFWKTDLAMYKYYQEKTGFSGDLARIAYRLIGYGILVPSTLINLAKIGLTPYLLITSRTLEEFERDYCFFHVKSSKAGKNFIGLALPPIASELGWKDGLAKENECLSIGHFSSGWNLSQLTTTGWEHPPSSLLATPNEKGLGQITWDFYTTPFGLSSADALYLERVQGSIPKDIKCEIGKDGQQRLHELVAMGAIQPFYLFFSIQIPDKMLVLFCQGAPTSLDKLQKAAYHFPSFRILRGIDWILTVLKMPSAWISSTLSNLKDFASHLSFENLTIDIDQRFAAERYLQFSKLWDPEKKQWVVWAP